MNEQIINSIKSVVKANGKQGITGTNLQGVLVDMVQSLGAFPAFAGMATPSTTPTTSDANVFYLSYEAGEYSGFGVTLDGETYNIIRRTSQGWEVVNTDIKTSEAIGEDIAEIISSALEGYSTTEQVAMAILAALQSYSTTEEVTQNITQALIPYAKKTEVTQAITTALQPYMTSEQTTQVIATAIATALTEYSTTAEMNAAIAQAVEGVNAEIIANELVAAAALNDLNDRVKKLPTKENISAEIDEKIQSLRNSIVAMRESIVAMIDTLRAEVINNELVAAASLNDLNSRI